MPRYLVERSYRDGLRIPTGAEGARTCLEMVEVNLNDGVTWVHSYVSAEDNKKSYCIYDAPNPEAIRRVAAKTKMPVDKITEVRVLNPYFYR